MSDETIAVGEVIGVCELCGGWIRDDSTETHTALCSELRLLGRRVAKLETMSKGEPIRWVAVGERLPAKGETVLVYSNEPELVIVMESSDNGQRWFSNDGFVRGVTHWAPVTAPERSE